jgi:hypothetical protein
LTTLTTNQKRILDDAACKMIALHKEVRRLQELLEKFEEHLRETMHDVVPLNLEVSKRKARRKMNASKRWSKRDDKFLRDHAQKQKVGRIAAQLHRTVAAVQTRAVQLGIPSLRKRRKHLRVAA